MSEDAYVALVADGEAVGGSIAGEVDDKLGGIWKQLPYKVVGFSVNPKVIAVMWLTRLSRALLMNLMRSQILLQFIALGGRTCVEVVLIGTRFI